MTYVLDSGPLINMFRHYYPDRFPSLWQRFDGMAEAGELVSVSEVAKELDGWEDRLSQWVHDNREFFHKPTVPEMTFVGRIFEVAHFQGLIRQQERLQGKPVADPFVIAKAAEIEDGCVVTTEVWRDNAPKVPNVCQHFGVRWLNLEDFMAEAGWTF
jgi:hypothetical protein